MKARWAYCLEAMPCRRMPQDAVTSLYRDLSGGKPAERTELAHIVGRMVEMGREAGVPVPYHAAVYERFASASVNNGEGYGGIRICTAEEVLDHE